MSSTSTGHCEARRQSQQTGQETPARQKREPRNEEPREESERGEPREAVRKGEDAACEPSVQAGLPEGLSDHHCRATRMAMSSREGQDKTSEATRGQRLHHQDVLQARQGVRGEHQDLQEAVLKAEHFKLSAGAARLPGLEHPARVQ